MIDPIHRGGSGWRPTRAGTKSSSRVTRQLKRECLAHMDSLYGLALRMTRNPQDAEDLVQDTYLKVLRSLDSHHSGKLCRAWLFRILTNTYIDRYRRDCRAPIQISFDDGAQSVYGEIVEQQASAAGPGEEPRGAGSIEEVLWESVSDEIKAAIDMLSDRLRETIVLRDIAGFSYKQCAEMLGVPVGTVMSRIHRGRRQLKERLRGYSRAYGYAGRAASAAV